MEDREIVDLYWARDEQAIEETDRKYGRQCQAIARNILGSEHDAVECVSDTWMSAWNSMPDQRPNHLLAFLGKIVRNLALDRWDYLHAKKRSAAATTMLSELEDCIPGFESTERHAEDQETAAVISRFLRTLDPDTRNIFLRRYWYADSISEIAARFSTNESRVKSSLFRTRKKLRAVLEKEGIAL